MLPGLACLMALVTASCAMRNRCVTTALSVTRTGRRQVKWQATRNIFLVRTARVSSAAIRPFGSDSTGCRPRAVFFLMAVSIVTPLILIVGYLVYQAWPILSLDFLLTNPRNGMRAGGIWSPLLGTIYLVVISLLVATPIGVLAAIFLNEHTRENLLTRGLNNAGLNLGGGPRLQ